MKLTPWFVNGKLPVRPGVYNVSCKTDEQSGKWFSYFDGKEFHGWCHSHPRCSKQEAIKQAASKPYINWENCRQPASWRGIYNEE